MPARSVHIETFGCQMNKLDSELVLEALVAEGFASAAGPDEAQVILFNTCSVREHAEARVYSRLGQLKRRAEREPDLVIGVLGCMAQKDAAGVFDRCPWVRLVVAPTHLADLPHLLRAALGDAPRRLLAVDADIRTPSPRADWNPPRWGLSPLPTLLPEKGTVPHSRTPAQRFVRIMTGCNNFCAYCIVPYVRGPEVCRPIDDIVGEVRRLADAGCREVTLLGQNVNSYRSPSPGAGAGAWDGGAVRLSELLERLNAVDGLARIRFVTSHPRDLTDDILDAMASLPKVCEHLHLPAQAGADAVLARMNRGYTRAQYLGIVERARERMPGIGLMSDFIVGFPGETEAEFAQTRSLIETVRYKNCFVFCYSPRPGTAAAERLTDDVPAAVKSARLAELLALQREIAAADHRAFLGREVEVLVEGPSKRSQASRARGQGPGAAESKVQNSESKIQLVGRTRSDHIVVFDGPRSLVGALAVIRIAAATDLTLIGEVVT